MIISICKIYSFICSNESFQPVTEADTACLNSMVCSIRDAARLVDSPANLLHVDAFVEHAKHVAQQLGPSVTIQVIQVSFVLTVTC